MRGCAVWPAIVVVAVLSMLLGCHGSSQQEDQLGAPGLGSDIIGVWQLFAIGPSFYGPWTPAAETGSSGTWTIATTGGPIRSAQFGDQTGVWSRALELPNRPTEHTIGTWGFDMRTGYYFTDASGKTPFYLQDGKLYYAIQEPGIFTGAVVWEKK